MEEFAFLDFRIIHADAKQSHNPFSKKSKFKKGISHFFKNTQSSRDSMASSTMSGGGLEAQRTPDLLFQLLFAVGTQGVIVPKSYVSNPDRNTEGGRYNPTEVLVTAMVSILDACWTIRLKTVPLDLVELEKIQLIINSANVHLQILFDMKQWLLSSSKWMASIKAHGCEHIPKQMALMGPHLYNDTDQCESSHILDKTEHKRNSKRDDCINEEMLQLVSVKSSF
jgi:hypothetical protein